MPFLGGTSYQAYPKKAYEAKRKTIGPHPVPKLQPYEPSWSEQIGGKLADWVTEGNKSNVGRQHWGEKYTTAAEMTPIPAIENVVEGAQDRDWSRVAKSAPELIPQEKALGAGLKGAGLFMSPYLMRDKTFLNWIKGMTGGKITVGSEGRKLTEEATRLHNAGFSEEDILKQTGISYTRSNDIFNKSVVPQIEISGRGMKLNPDLPLNRMAPEGHIRRTLRDPERLKANAKIGDIVEWPEFFNASPAFEHVKNTPIFRSDNPDVFASMMRRNKSDLTFPAMTIQPSHWTVPKQASEYGVDELIPNESAVATIGHEFTHIPQSIMRNLGVSGGANPSDFVGIDQMPLEFFEGPGGAPSEAANLIKGLHGRYTGDRDLSVQAYLDTVGETQADIGGRRMAFDEATQRAVLPDITTQQIGRTPRQEQIPTEPLAQYVQHWNSMTDAERNAFKLKALSPGGSLWPFGAGIP